MRSLRLRIHGIVQGVWFRASTREAAEIHRLSGWVRNTPDGSVEAFVQGPDASVEKFLQWCRQGPAGARVDSLDVSPAEPDPDLKGFTIRR
jgi:acylphosphatase